MATQCTSSYACTYAFILHFLLLLHTWLVNNLLEEMVYTVYKKQRIVYFHSLGLRPPTIAKHLSEEGLKASCQGIAKFIQQYEQTGTIVRKPGSGRPTKITAEIKAIVEEQMQRDNETSAVQLHTLLQTKGHSISLPTILHCHSALGWTFCGSTYCQLIREANKQKRLEWAVEHQHNDFGNVIWTDEATVQLETHRRLYCRKFRQ